MTRREGSGGHAILKGLGPEVNVKLIKTLRLGKLLQLLRKSLRECRHVS